MEPNSSFIKAQGSCPRLFCIVSTWKVLGTTDCYFLCMRYYPHLFIFSSVIKCFFYLISRVTLNQVSNRLLC